ncbi:MAG: hypothetical protein J6J65_05050 [Opitutales bacterium]|nr:hypothetical protein [Opitutales bacterium]
MRYIASVFAAAVFACSALSGHAQAAAGTSNPAASRQCREPSAQCAGSQAREAESAQKSKKAKKARGYANRRTER